MVSKRGQVETGACVAAGALAVGVPTYTAWHYLYHGENAKANRRRVKDHYNKHKKKYRMLGGAAALSLAIVGGKYGHKKYKARRSSKSS